MTHQLNRDRFLKVLSLAESDHDAEALAAIRKAAAMARAAGMSLGEAVGGTEQDSLTGLREMILETELAAARREIADLKRKASSERDDANFAKGFEAGKRYGAEQAGAEMKEQAFRRVKQLEAELEAYRAPLDWTELAERFYSKNRRGLKSPYAKGMLYRASINKLTPSDQAELRSFAAKETRPPRRTVRREACEAEPAA